MGVPVLVGDACCGRKLTSGEGGMHVTGGDGEFMEDPAFRE